jgi:hypothetical protein
MFSLPSKNPTEVVTISFMFGSEIATGDSISGCSVTATTFNGVDSNPSAILYGVPNLSLAPTVMQRITGGLTGCQYHLKAVATLVSGGVLVREAILPVQSNLP